MRFLDFEKERGREVGCMVCMDVDVNVELM